MKKFILILVLILSACFVQAEVATCFSKTSLDDSTTYYLLIDRSDTTNFKHGLTSTAGTMVIYYYNITISSNTTEAKIGYITEINTSSGIVCWFGRVSKDSPADADVSIGCDRLLKLNSNRNYIGAATSADAYCSSVDKLKNYNGTATIPALGDVVLKVTGTDTFSAVDVFIEYDVTLRP